jgi:predicted metal-dependent HD superfamily phosphohydrolase
VNFPDAWLSGCDPAVLAAAREAYASPGRHYHTWQHVLECAETLRDFECDAPRDVFLALLFHDAVYVAGRGDNEARSAALAAEILRKHSRVPDSDITEIARMILATRDHRAPPGESSRDLRIVVDIDMSILGAEPARYAAYVEGVRREFVPLAASEAQFAQGRVRFLRAVLSMPRIYATDEGFERWEDLARRNVAAEIESLGRSPGC